MDIYKWSNFWWLVLGTVLGRAIWEAGRDFFYHRRTTITMYYPYVWKCQVAGCSITIKCSSLHTVEELKAHHNEVFHNK